MDVDGEENERDENCGYESVTHGKSNTKHGRGVAVVNVLSVTILSFQKAVKLIVFRLSVQAASLGSYLFIIILCREYQVKDLFL